MKLTLKLEIRQLGSMIHARVEGQSDLTIATVAAAACDADRTVFEDFQALSVKALDALVKSGCGAVAESYSVQPAGPDVAESVESRKARIESAARTLIDESRAMGFNVSIEPRALQPLAMRNYDLAVNVWPVQT